MSRNNFVSVVSFLFLVIAIIHALRLISGWEAVIGGFSVPMWASILAVLLAGYLSFQGFRISKKG